MQKYMFDTLTPIDTVSSRHHQRGRPPRGGMSIYLDQLLVESVEVLTDCAAGPMLALSLRERIIRVIHEVCTLREVMPGLLGRIAPNGTTEVFSEMTAVMVVEMARSGLFEAFQDRCASLSGRLGNADTDAAIDELRSGVVALRRNLTGHGFSR